MAKYDDMYMGFAIKASEESHCPRTQVGCVVVLESGVIAPGFNGHASGGPNDWEFSPTGNPEVVHAPRLGRLSDDWSGIWILDSPEKYYQDKYRHREVIL